VGSIDDLLLRFAHLFYVERAMLLAARLGVAMEPRWLSARNAELAPDAKLVDELLDKASRLGLLDKALEEE